MCVCWMLCCILGGKGSKSVMMESTSYTDMNAANEREAERKRQAKMFQTSGILTNLLEDYDSRLRPQFGGDPVEVNLDV